MGLLVGLEEGNDVGTIVGLLVGCNDGLLVGIFDENRGSRHRLDDERAYT